MLAGTGLSLFSAHARIAGDAAALRQHRHTLWRPAAALFAFGALSTPVWPADFLRFHGVDIALAAFCLARHRTVLVGFTLALPVAFCTDLRMLDYEYRWNVNTLDYCGLWTLDGMLHHFLFNGFNPVVPWLAFVFHGMLLGRLRLPNTGLQRRMVVWSASVAVLTEILSLTLVALASGDLDLGAHSDTESMPPVPLYLIAAVGNATALIGACLALARRVGDARVLSALVHTGLLALTRCSAHVFVGFGTLETLGLLGKQCRGTAVLTSALFCLLAVGFAHGPANRLLRRLSRR
ncbi:MAG: hypothetical protein AAGA11_05235 [Pseudomonadota bacterium]